MHPFEENGKNIFSDWSDPAWIVEEADFNKDILFAPGYTPCDAVLLPSMPEEFPVVPK